MSSASALSSSHPASRFYRAAKTEAESLPTKTDATEADVRRTISRMNYNHCLGLLATVADTVALSLLTIPAVAATAITLGLNQRTRMWVAGIRQRLAKDAELIQSTAKDLFRGLHSSVSSKTKDEILASWCHSPLYGRAFSSSPSLLGPAFALREPDLYLQSIDGLKIPVHRSVFEGRCQRFASMLSPLLAEGRGVDVPLKLHEEALLALRQYCYTGRLYCTDFHSLLELLQFAHMAEFHELHARCSNALSASDLSRDEVVAVLKLKKVACTDELMDRCFSYVAAHTDQNWGVLANKDLRVGYISFLRRLDSYVPPTRRNGADSTTK